MERPNTVSGLKAKRKELTKLLKAIDAEYKSVACDIDHIDACIRLFDPKAQMRRIRHNRHATKHRAKRGEHQKFVLDRLREAIEPLTSRDISSAWIVAHGLQPDDSTRVILSKRTTTTISSLKKRGIVEFAGRRGEYKLWRLVEQPLLVEAAKPPLLT